MHQRKLNCASSNKICVLPQQRSSVLKIISSEVKVLRRKLGVNLALAVQAHLGESLSLKHCVVRVLQLSRVELVEFNIPLDT